MAEANVEGAGEKCDVYHRPVRAVHHPVRIIPLSWLTVSDNGRGGDGGQHTSAAICASKLYTMEIRD